MKLPPEAIIAEEKLTRYLLVRQARGDKSAFLERAGYTPHNSERLREDLRRLILLFQATPLGSNKFGQYFEVPGELRGPNGVTLRVRTIWMKEHLSGITKFITLVPDKRRNHETGTV